MTYIHFEVKDGWAREIPWGNDEELIFDAARVEEIRRDRRMTANLCPEGRQLYQAWTRELDQGNKDFIFDAMSQYFHHKNICRECCGIAVYEWNKENTPSLFKQETQ